MKNLKIPKGYSETVNQRPQNTMVKWKIQWSSEKKDNKNKQWSTKHYTEN